MAIYELVVNQSQNGKSIVNRFHYTFAGTIGTILPSLALCFAFGYAQESGVPYVNSNSLWLKMINLMSSQLKFESFTAKNLYDPTDFYDLPINGNITGGITATEANSPAMAIKFRSSRVRTDIGRGYKAFAGITEGLIGPNGILLTSGSIATIVSELSTALGSPLTYVDEGTTLTFTPCVLGLERIEPVAPATKVKYRKYATQAAQEAHIASGMSWDVVPTIRTQRSRQYV